MIIRDVEHSCGHTHRTWFGDKETMPDNAVMNFISERLAKLAAQPCRVCAGHVRECFCGYCEEQRRPQPKATDMVSKRLKILRCEPDLIVAVLNGLSRNQFIRLPVTPEIPEGTQVVSLHTDWSSHTIGLMLEHPSFDEVPDNQEIPSLWGDYTQWHVAKWKGPEEVDVVAQVKEANRIAMGECGLGKVVDSAYFGTDEQGRPVTMELREKFSLGDRGQCVSTVKGECVIPKSLASEALRGADRLVRDFRLLDGWKRTRTASRFEDGVVSVEIVDEEIIGQEAKPAPPSDDFAFFFGR